MSTPPVTSSVVQQPQAKAEINNSEASSVASKVSELPEAFNTNCAKCQGNLTMGDARFVYLPGTSNSHSLHQYCPTGKYENQETCPRCNPNRFCVIS